MPRSLARLQAEFDKRVAEGGRDNATFGIEADGRLIGHRGLFNCSDTDRHGELGSSIGDKALWSQGYGRDAVRVLLEYACRCRNLHGVFLRVISNNERGIRAYLACGCVEEGRLRQHVWSDGRCWDLVHMGVLARRLAAHTARIAPRGQSSGQLTFLSRRRISARRSVIDCHVRADGEYSAHPLLPIQEINSPIASVAS